MREALMLVPGWGRRADRQASAVRGQELSEYCSLSKPVGSGLGQGQIVGLNEAQ